MKDAKYQVLIADDHSIVRYGTALVIKEMLPAGTIREANNFDQALKLLDTDRFDLLVLDINIPGGNNLQMIDVVKLRQPHVKILIFSGYDEQLYALRYLQAGADGYVVKQAPEGELKAAIQTIQNNDKYISPTVKQHLINGLTTKKASARNPLTGLSNREMEVMQLLVKGASVAEIGVTLSLQISTVSTYKSRIFEKMEVSNIVELVEKVKLYDTSSIVNYE
ncbi:response regulator transcription factor [Pseudoflavitalea sp. X16]|uniref:response regulator n=1 Tax=Paraflavitalea devenefica TaxID=2716334 RepID=UPI00141EC293|nr:response regulator transcription factor [Paraflavitalea devenefica]NII26062.1 response regulator transcription factor [Paraflavitalea devenefica]